MSDERDALDRAIKVYRSLKRFRQACFENIYIEGWPLKYCRPFQRGLQTFEGVVDTYDIAFDLLEAIGPGRGHEVDWLPGGCDPRLRTRVGDAARLARNLILETWGWPPGLDRDTLVSLAHERKRTGNPTLRALLVEAKSRARKLYASYTPEQRAEAHTDPPPFRAEVPPDRREQFDRIVQAQLDEVRPLSTLPTPWADPYWISRGHADHVRWETFEHIDDLDAYERRLSAPRPRDPEVEARIAEEDHLYQELPLIGRQAAKLHIMTWRKLEYALDDLRIAIKAVKTRLKRASGQSASDAVPESRVRANPNANDSIGRRHVNQKSPKTDMMLQSRFVGAILELKQQGKRLSLLAVCNLAGVDRKNIRNRHPELMAILESMRKPDRDIRKGDWDRRSGNLEAIDEADD